MFSVRIILPMTGIVNKSLCKIKGEKSLAKFGWEVYKQNENEERRINFQRQRDTQKDRHDSDSVSSLT